MIERSPASLARPTLSSFPPSKFSHLQEGPLGKLLMLACRYSITSDPIWTPYLRIEYDDGQPFSWARAYACCSVLVQIRFGS
jgi:hypothetical protein